MDETAGRWIEEWAGDYYTFALDESSQRIFDVDGHLHVADSIISAAQINPYIGREIPEYEALGLDPNRRFDLWRDPDELEKGAGSFHGKPLLQIHKPLTANIHDKAVVIGAVMNPFWDGQHLRAELVVWDAGAIRDIESGKKSDLSSGYRYDAVMDPGVWKGKPYDGKMINIVGNHVTIVKEGRVDGAIVGDSKIEETEMAKIVLSSSAAVALGALLGYIGPKLAKDATIDLLPALAGVTTVNFRSKKPMIVSELKRITTGKLAMDAKIEDVTELLDKLEKNLPAEDAELTTQPNAGVLNKSVTVDEEAETEEEKKARMEKRAKDKAAKDKAAKDKAARDAAETPEEKASREKKEAEDRAAKDAEIKDRPTKAAMDEAIAAAVTGERKKQQDIQEALRAVRPHVGELQIAQDSAESVYITALTMKGEKADEVKDLPLPALKMILRRIPLPGAEHRMAQDIGRSTRDAEVEFKAMFPGARDLVRS